MSAACVSAACVSAACVSAACLRAPIPPVDEELLIDAEDLSARAARDARESGK
jgi:hypothetical protein